MRFYSGIGSRRTPQDQLRYMVSFASAARQRGLTLRSGHADGADKAFERGAGGSAHIFLPFAGFNRETPVLGLKYVNPTREAFELAARFHPAWHVLNRDGRRLMARNTHEVLGWGLDEPSEFVVCWTEDGSLDGVGRGAGGTGQALRIAHAPLIYTVDGWVPAPRIPVFNLQRPGDRERLEALLTAPAPG